MVHRQCQSARTVTGGGTRRREGVGWGVPRHAAVTPVTLVTGLRLPPLSSPQGGSPLLLSPSRWREEEGSRASPASPVGGRRLCLRRRLAPRRRLLGRCLARPFPRGVGVLPVAPDAHQRPLLGVPVLKLHSGTSQCRLVALEPFAEPVAVARKVFGRRPIKSQAVAGSSRAAGPTFGRPTHPLPPPCSRLRTPCRSVPARCRPRPAPRR